ncbi:MAG: pilus assembly protein PilM [marine benthic group bacterium]|nr:pilus assembly protein PilM [Gemmatimonadota bacterium]MCL7957429.1 pilus assembly protein PilM [Gemmatimonadota bacterium]MCL7964722.1 pilus assembly protein PilM [Gemmatimonadota bacterium]MCL7967820.1 pilus assembly protein PilM [Gemmatimonadota bacterium]MCL7969044.1 pilus assembly protein PilM [Gemmatimonadota bacterium]
MGLDIGSGFVKVAVVDHSGSAPLVERLIVRPLGADAIVEGEVMDPGLVAQTVDAIFDEEGLSQRDVVVSVGGRDVIIKPIQMDRMRKSDAKEVIRWEAEQHVPFDMDDVQLDFEVTDPEGEGLQMGVLLVAAKRELVENKVALLEEANLNPRIIDVDAFALHNALEINYPEAMRGLSSLVSIGHETTNVNILEDGVPVLTRDLSFGTRRLSLDLQRERGMLADEAENVLRGEGADERLRSFLYERAQEVGRGIERATAFLETQEVGASLGRLYLCGGGVHVPGIAEALAERLEIETTVANPIERLGVKPGALDLDAARAIAPLMMLSVGLALRRIA